MLLAFVVYLAIGAVAGFLSGLLGLGGGIVIVPALAYAFMKIHLDHGLVMHMAAATSLSTMLVTSIFALRVHIKSFTVVWQLVKPMLVGVLLGTGCGAVLANYLPSAHLRFIFGFIMLLVASHILLGRRLQLDKPPRLKAWQLQLAATITGSLSGMLGIGGSSLMTPFLNFLQYDMRKIIPITISLGFLSATIGSQSLVLLGWGKPALPPHSLGYVYWPAALSIVLMSPWFAILGARLSRRLDVRVLKRLFAVFLLMVAFDMLLGNYL